MLRTHVTTIPVCMMSLCDEYTVTGFAQLELLPCTAGKM
jgi:hypothetical protein